MCIRDRERLARLTLLEKAEILRNGSAKRGKLDRAAFYEELIQSHHSKI